MLEKKELLQTSEHLFDELQNELFRQVSQYMKDNDLNQIKLAEKLGVTKGYISQILNGNCNFSLKKLVELSLAIGKIPVIHFVPADEKTQDHFSGSQAG